MSARREWLARAAAGATALALARLEQTLAAGAVKQGVARVRGEARVDGRLARPGIELRPGDTIRTGPGAELVGVLGADAFLVRAETRLELGRGLRGRALGVLRLLSGALLSVFPAGERREIRSATATIGIRGTGIYVEIEEVRTYCTCYGAAELAPADDPTQAELVRTTHHDQPRYIYAPGAPRRIERAPVVNHADAELILLESLVGRTVPFVPSRYD